MQTNDGDSGASRVASSAINRMVPSDSRVAGNRRTEAGFVQVELYSASRDRGGHALKSGKEALQILVEYWPVPVFDLVEYQREITRVGE